MNSGKVIAAPLMAQAGHGTTPMLTPSAATTIINRRSENRTRAMRMAEASICTLFRC